jgi:biopolymer transport protein ExbD
MFGDSIIKKSRHQEINFELQITALIDTLVIILIFLLKSISTDTLELEQSKNLASPMVSQGVSSGKGAKLSIATDAISWNSVKHISMVQFKSTDAASSIGGQNWGALAAAITETANKEKEAKTFTGAIFVEADKNTPFQLLSATLKVAKQQGYKDIRFIGARYN